MAEAVDYGYGDGAPDGQNGGEATPDYGYGDGAPDYGYRDGAPDYGYGEGAPGGEPNNSGGATDYGYGDAAPDYGYGDAAPDNTDYGYGEAAPDYGYGEAAPDYGYGEGAPSGEPAPAPEEKKRPKRRCSVTRFSIEAEACDRPLDYNWQGQPEGEAAPPPAEQPQRREHEQNQLQPADDKSAAMTESTAGTSSDEDDMLSKVKVNTDDDDMLSKVRAAHASRTSGAMPKKKGMLGRIRKRLSII